MIRPATPADRPALLALQSLLPESSPDLLEAAVDGDVGVVLVDEADGRPVGYALATVGPDLAHWTELAVDPAYRREGRGRALATALFGRLASRVDRVRLTVDPDDDAALSLHESLGFEVVGREPGFYADGDALVMEKRL